MTKKELEQKINILEKKQLMFLNIKSAIYSLRESLLNLARELNLNDYNLRDENKKLKSKVPEVKRGWCEEKRIRKSL